MISALDVSNVTLHRPVAGASAPADPAEAGDSFLALLSLMSPETDQTSLPEDATAEDDGTDQNAATDASLFALWSPFAIPKEPAPVALALPAEGAAATAEGAVSPLDLPPSALGNGADLHTSGKAVAPVPVAPLSDAEATPLTAKDAAPDAPTLPQAEQKPALPAASAQRERPAIDPTPKPVAAPEAAPRVEPTAAAIAGSAATGTAALMAGRRSDTSAPAQARDGQSVTLRAAASAPSQATRSSVTETVATYAAGAPQPVTPVGFQMEPAVDPSTTSISAPTDSTPAAAPDLPTIATDQVDWEQHVVDAVTSAITEDGAVIDLALTPETLGDVEVRVEMRDGRAEVTFLTETREAAKLFTQSEARLSDLLARHGLDLSGQNASSRQDGRGNAQAGAVREQPTLEAAAAVLAPSTHPQGRLNLIA